MELWDAYDSTLQKLPLAPLVRGEAIPDGVFHLVCEILVRHTDGSYLLMQRDPRKHEGGKWEASAGGSALCGESPEACARRELYEETGIHADTLLPLGTETVPAHRSVYCLFLCMTDTEKTAVRLQQGETVAFQWVSASRLLSMGRDSLASVRTRRFVAGEDKPPLTLIRRCPAFVAGYKAYCEEFYEHQVTYFVPSNPAQIDDGWFVRTKEWYDKKETGEIPDQPKSFHYWAVSGDRFIGEFQLRTEMTEQVMRGIGSVGYAVRVTEQGKGYGCEILRQGLQLARQHGMEWVLLNINEENAVSRHVCEKCGGVLLDRIPAYNRAEGDHVLCRYRITL